MGRYCNTSDVVIRFRRVTDVTSYPDAVDTHYIFYAENELDLMLGNYFTVPFSSNNVTAKDLAIDLSYAKVIRYDDMEKYDSIMGYVNKRISDLILGNSVMMTTSGTTISPSTSAGGAWSSTQSWHSAFGLDDTVFHHPSETELDYEASLDD